jgi:single-strand DNA-binding protein
MAGVNRVTLLGNLGTDPEARHTPKQVAVCRFRLATSERRKSAEGSWGEHTEWHNVVVFGKTAENCANFLRKGRQVYMEGALRTRTWQGPDEQMRHVTEVVASNVQFLGGKEATGAGPERAGETDTAFPELSDEAGAISGDDEGDFPF